MHIVTIDNRNPHSVRVVAAVLAVAITIGLFYAVIGLFQILGAPLGELARAERACTERTYRSEREACIRQWSIAHHVRVAHR